MKKVLIVVAVLVLAFVGFVATRPSVYQVERKVSIAAPADVAYAHVSDFHQWVDWSPWAKIDPAMKTTYEGQTGATGSSYAWNGNDKVGAGKMTITDAKPNDRVAINLEFIRPFASTSKTEFDFKPNGANTDVVWKMNGEMG